MIEHGATISTIDWTITHTSSLPTYRLGPQSTARCLVNTCATSSLCAPERCDGAQTIGFFIPLWFTTQSFAPVGSRTRRSGKGTSLHAPCLMMVATWRLFVCSCETRKVLQV